MLILKIDKFKKFTVGSYAFQTFKIRSTKNFCLRLDVHLGLNKLLVTSSISDDWWVVSTTKTAQLIDMPYMGWTRVSPTNALVERWASRGNYNWTIPARITNRAVITIASNYLLCFTCTQEKQISQSLSTVLLKKLQATKADGTWHQYIERYCTQMKQSEIHVWSPCILWTAFCKWQLA